MAPAKTFIMEDTQKNGPDAAFKLMALTLALKEGNGATARMRGWRQQQEELSVKRRLFGRFALIISVWMQQVQG